MPRGSPSDRAHYLAYALRILKNAGLPCEGVTTPGGFGNRALPALSQATLESCRDVFSAEIPHYFRHLYTDERSVAPRVENASGLDGPNPRCVVSIIGCTGDWFGGWDGLTPGSVDRFIPADLKGGRLPEVIARGEPAILVCHWPGIYYNGDEVGFNIFKRVVGRLEEAYDNLIWMKLSEIARYWAAKGLTAIRVQDRTIHLDAPFACPAYTIRVPGIQNAKPNLKRVTRPRDLRAGTWFDDARGTTLCFDLKKGESSFSV